MIAAEVTARVVSMLLEVLGVRALPQQVSFEVAERSSGVRYPAVYVYCERVANTLREKFRTFSGRASMVIEIRVSSDRLEGVSQKLGEQVDAVAGVLNGGRGPWGEGLFYTGAYEVEFGPVKHGGKNFLEAAKVKFDVEVSAG